MKHIITENKTLGIGISEITVTLIPENPEESKAINNVEIRMASNAESVLIDAYLHFQITDYSISNVISQHGSVFKLKVVNL